MSNIYTVTFEKYQGESKWLRANNLADAIKKAEAWSKRHRFGPIQSMEYEGSIDIE